MSNKTLSVIVVILIFFALVLTYTDHKLSELEAQLDMLSIKAGGMLNE